MVPIIIGLAGGALGGLAGAFLVAPKIAPAAPSAATTDAKPKSESGDKSDKNAKSDKKDAKAGQGRVYRVDNVIVNPLGSGGTRFLMASVAFEVQDEAAEQALHAQEVRLRDDVIGALEGMTLERLTQPHARDTIKVQLLVIAKRILGPQTPVDVYMPQFVIQ